nr:hypothetical protein [Micromonospora sp. DSM 115978]
MAANADGILAALRLVLSATHTARADDVPGVVAAAGRYLGAAEALFYVIDYDQVLLVPLTAEAVSALVSGNAPAS